MLFGPDDFIKCPHCGCFERLVHLISGNTFNAQFWTDGEMIAGRLPRGPSVSRCQHCRRFYWVGDAEKVDGMLIEAQPKLEPKGSRFARRIAELSTSDYLEAIDAGLATTREEEINLRVLTWWASTRAEKRFPGIGCLGILLFMLGLATHFSLSELVSGKFAGSLILPLFLGWMLVTGLLVDCLGYPFVRLWRWFVAGNASAFERNLQALYNLLDENQDRDRLTKAETARQLSLFDEAIRLLSWNWPESLSKYADRLRQFAIAGDRKVRLVMRAR
jgi:hypothetical protein